MPSSTAQSRQPDAQPSSRAKIKFAVTPSAAAFDARLTATDVRVLHALASYANRNGDCHPAQGTLARRLGLARRTIMRAIERLVATGHVRVAKRNGAGGARLANRYTIVLESSQGELPFDGPPATEMAHGYGDTPVTLDAHPCDVGGTPRTQPRKNTTSPPPTGDGPRADERGNEQDGDGEDGERTGARSKRKPKPRARPKPPPRRPAVAHYLPEDYTPDLDAAVAIGIPPQLARRVAAAFVDHWLAEDSPSARKRNWDAAWRTWCRRELERLPRGGSSAGMGRRRPGRGDAPPRAGAAADDPVLAALRRRRAEGGDVDEGGKVIDLPVGMVAAR